MDNNVINMFSKKAIQISADAVSKEFLLDYWKERNEIIASTFMSLSVYEKQSILETVLSINNELYETVLKLKGKI